MLILLGSIGAKSLIYQEMSQNLLSLTLSDEQLRAVDDALTALETSLTSLISLTPEQRRALNRMGPKSENFCRQTMTVLEQNPQVLPPSVDLQEAKAGLAALGKLRPRLARPAEEGGR